MSEENKPLDTDTSDETLDEDIDEIFDSSQESQVEEGENDVSEAINKDEIFLKTMKSISGREFKSVEDAKKHYKNLASFVGKKEEPKEEPVKQEEPNQAVQDISSKLEKMEFVSDNPDAKQYFDSHIKPFAEGKDLSLTEAWKELQPLFESKKAQDDEQEIGVNSKNVITPKTDPALKGLREKALKGNSEAQEEFVAKMLGQ